MRCLFSLSRDVAWLAARRGGFAHRRPQDDEAHAELISLSPGIGSCLVEVLVFGFKFQAENERHFEELHGLRKLSF